MGKRGVPYVSWHRGGVLWCTHCCLQLDWLGSHTIPNCLILLCPKGQKRLISCLGKKRFDKAVKMHSPHTFFLSIFALIPCEIFCSHFIFLSFAAWVSQPLRMHDVDCTEERFRCRRGGHQHNKHSSSDWHTYTHTTHPSPLLLLSLLSPSAYVAGPTFSTLQS